MRKLIALLAMLAGAALSPAQTLKAPATVDISVSEQRLIVLETDCESVVWLVADPGIGLFDGASLGGDPKRAFVLGLRDGSRARVFIIGAKGGKQVTATMVVTVGKAPEPGPGPGPGPVPPTPAPAPIPDAGFRVLMVYESSELNNIPASQVEAMRAQSVRQYLDAKCVVGPDGKTKEWRIWDKDVDATKADKLWRDALARKRDSLPWIIISDGKKGFEGPLPKTVDDMLKLLKSIGGD